MKKLHVLTAAGILLALAGPSVAATRTHASSANRVTAYGDVNTVRTYGDPPYGPIPGYNAYARSYPEQQYRYAPSQQSVPFSGRPYGDPDGW